jgi:type IV secretion system protein VirB8
MFGKKASSPQIDNAVSKAVNFEITIADMARRSERRAWFVASGAILLSLVLAAGYFYMLPLKEKVPYLVMADAYTGTSSVARLDEDLGDRSITSSEAVNRSNVAHFVLARESYDLAMINLRDWTTVYSMSSPDVAAGYTNLHSVKNLSGPRNVYGKTKAIRVNILSISLIPGAGKAKYKGATVRFQRSLFDKASGASAPLDSKIATIEFTYKSNLKMDEKYRHENPLGFQVTNYRVDSDYDATPPMATAVPSAPVMQAPANALPVAPGTLPENAGYPAAAYPPAAYPAGAYPPAAPPAAAPAATAQPGSVPPPPPLPTDNSNGASNR